MLYILGIITGLIAAVVLLIGGIYFRPKVERRVNQVASSLKEKGSIIEPEGDLEEWLDSLKTE